MINLSKSSDEESQEEIEILSSSEDDSSDEEEIENPCKKRKVIDTRNDVLGENEDIKNKKNMNNDETLDHHDDLEFLSCNVAE
jgi:hypothetical protein